ncbi:unnamed protein product [Sympodiomycopsis kandeliae]
MGCPISQEPYAALIKTSINRFATGNLFAKEHLTLGELPMVTYPENENVPYFNHTEVKSSINLWRACRDPEDAKPILMEWQKQMARCQLLAIKTMPEAPWQDWLERLFTSVTMHMFAPLMPNGTRTNFRRASRADQVQLVIKRATSQTAATLTAALAADIRRQPDRELSPRPA